MGGIQFLLKTSSGRYLSSPVPAACSWKGGPGASLLSRLLPMCSLTSSVMLTETIEKVHVIELATALCFIWRQQKLVKWVPQQKPWGFSGGCSCRGGCFMAASFTLPRGHGTPRPHESACPKTAAQSLAHARSCCFAGNLHKTMPWLSVKLIRSRI